ncbi:hypothetical protein H0W91_02150 [Patescibacteria group bacterium]|nr:hypothetical protein [Patescibacteria group bacterium]
MKKAVIFTLLVVVFSGVWFFYNRIYSIKLNYVEPKTTFNDKSSINESDIVVKITAQGFVPSSINIKKGKKVFWLNESGTLAWPASNPHPTHSDYPGFDPELPMPVNQSWSFVFNRVGRWGYHNHLNSAFRGVVNVSE